MVCGISENYIWVMEGIVRGETHVKKAKEHEHKAGELLLEIAKELKQEIGKSTRTSKAMRTSNI